VGLYREAWLEARATRRDHKPLSDEFLWHDLYNLYAEKMPRLSAEAELELVRLWQDHGDVVARAKLIEALYGIVRKIAGKIATKRFPPPLVTTKVAFDGQRDRIHELASVGIFGLFVAADRFKPESGCRFSTYANPWVRKYIQLYCEEIVSVVPRTAHRGIEDQDVGPDGDEWIVYKPRLIVMDIVEAALEGRRLYRGKAAGGMALFDAGFFSTASTLKTAGFPPLNI
jgi:Sigma-70 region 2